MAKKKVVKKTPQPVRKTKKKATRPPKGSKPPKKVVYQKKVTKKELAEAAEKVGSDEDNCTLEGENILTLLQISNRRKLPTKPTPNQGDKIVEIVHERPLDYKFFITMLRDGASLSSACAASGICSYEYLMNMLRKGAQDINRDPAGITDTYFSRLYIDVSRTAGIVRSEAESKVMSDDPKFWLRNSPLSRMFGDEWRDDPGKSSQVTHTHVHRGSVEHFLNPPSEQEANPDELILTEEDTHSVLEEFAQAGLITLQPDFHLAKKIQAGEILTEEEMEGMLEEDSAGSDGVLELDIEGMPLMLPKPKE